MFSSGPKLARHATRHALFNPSHERTVAHGDQLKHRPRMTVGPEPPPVQGARWLPLTRGRWALLDDEDFAALSLLSWCFCTSSGYAVRKAKGRKVQMHAVIAGTPSGMDTDHINRNKLDNRRSNLRIATRTQNNGNHGMSSRNTSGYRGVSWDKRDKVWKAYLSRGKTLSTLPGSYANPEDAARAFDDAARGYFGEFARLNFPREGERGAREAA